MSFLLIGFTSDSISLPGTMNLHITFGDEPYSKIILTREHRDVHMVAKRHTENQLQRSSTSLKYFSQSMIGQVRSHKFALDRKMNN